jgi:hypothetical protein
MLPPGHIAAGYLLGEGIVKIFPYELTPSDKKKLIWFSMFIAFSPDLDSFYSFYKSTAFTVNSAITNHRIYLSHTPILWLAAGFLIFVLAKKPLYKVAGLLVWLASWSHFILDSIEYGVRWLWPFSKNQIALISTSDSVHITQMKFLDYWITFLKEYTHFVTFYCEIVVILAALIVASKYLKPYIFNRKS